ncbi:MAG: glycoside hydrolase family 57 protein [Proteobacteria bacterium]|nr:glycoside hydrolase family 57 protein [Pseudomonadota bacterium]
MSSHYPLNIAILWHMHQPMYYDPEIKKFRMPWVRLHCTKDYLDMLEILDGFKKVRPVFNLTPSLLKQIDMYLQGVPEYHLELTLKDPQDLTPYEKTIILKDFFMANWDLMIKPIPRYYELLSKRGKDIDEKGLLEAQRFFSKQDLLDLQVLFNLVWTDPTHIKKDPFLSELKKKGRGYTSKEKEELIKRHYEIMGRIISSYKKAYLDNEIEISFSPFYHPILPLIIDNRIATISDSSTKLPKPFSWQEDARNHIKKSKDYLRENFGKIPVGMWPSEGSVSNEALKIMIEEEIKWTATDETVLFNSLKLRDRWLNSLTPQQLFRSYHFPVGDKKIELFFRDHRLSDNIGFVYSKYNPRDAIEHFLNSLRNIKKFINYENNIVSIILDGENAWEFYPNDGFDFLTTLYNAIEKADDINMITFSDYINKYPNSEPLYDIHPGSWINGNFKIWIGHPEDNQAWDHLTTARNIIEEKKDTIKSEKLDEVMESLYIAEGSDWCWWYGDEHSTEFELEFDELFRKYIKDIYIKLGVNYPESLNSPIVKKEKDIKPDKEILSYIKPKIDGKISSYFEWLGSGSFNLTKYGLAMHRSTIYFEELLVGFDQENLYLRLDPENGFLNHKEYFPFGITITIPSKGISIEGSIEESGNTNFLLKNENKIFEIESAFQKILELRVPLSLIGFSEDELISFYINVQLATSETIRFPIRGNIVVTVPAKNFEDYIWHA